MKSLARLTSPCATSRTARLTAGWLAGLSLLASLGLGGCGSVTASSSISDARHAVDEVNAHDGDKYAPYETTRATVYLQKAKKLQGEGMYEQATEYARISQTAAEKAVDVARLNEDREKRRQKFAPKDAGTRDRPAEPPKAPSFTPSGG